MIFPYLYKHRYVHIFPENKQRKCLVLIFYLYMKDNIILLNDFCRFKDLHFITHDIQHLQSLQLHTFSQHFSDKENVWRIEYLCHALAVTRSFKYVLLAHSHFLLPVFLHESHG